MKSSSKLFAALILVILVLAWWLGQTKTPYTGTLEASLVPFFDTSLKVEDFRTLTIYTGKDASDTKKHMVLEQTDGKWALTSDGGYPVSSSRLESLLRALLEMRGRFRSNDPNLDEFQIKDEQALHIKGRTTKGEFHLVFGKKGPKWDEQFVKKAGENNVYIADRNISSHVGIHKSVLTAELDKKYFLEMQIYSIQPEKLTRIELTYPEKLSFVQETGVVRLEGSSEIALDTEKVNRWKSYLRSPWADGAGLDVTPAAAGLETSENWIELTEAPSVTTPAKTGEVAVKSQPRKIRLVLGNRTGDSYYVKLSDSKFIYTLPEYNVKEIFVSLEKLKAETKPAGKEENKEQSPENKENKEVPAATDKPSDKKEKDKKVEEKKQEDRKQEESKATTQKKGKDNREKNEEQKVAIPPVTPTFSPGTDVSGTPATQVPIEVRTSQSSTQSASQASSKPENTNPETGSVTVSPATGGISESNSSTGNK